MTSLTWGDVFAEVEAAPEPVSPALRAAAHFAALREALDRAAGNPPLTWEDCFEREAA